MRVAGAPHGRKLVFHLWAVLWVALLPWSRSESAKAVASIVLATAFALSLLLHGSNITHKTVQR